MDLDAQRKGKAAVIKTSTRQVYTQYLLWSVYMYRASVLCTCISLHVEPLHIIILLKSGWLLGLFVIVSGVVGWGGVGVGVGWGWGWGWGMY